MAVRKATPLPELARRFRETWQCRTPEHTAEGVNWYALAREECERIADASGRPVERVILAMSALSPQLRWSVNVRMCREMAMSRRFRNPGCLPACARLAWGCLQGTVTEVSGAKRRAFAAAIVGDLEAVTIDRHMITLVGHPYPGLSPQQSEYYAGAVASFARSVGHTPRETQAILWCVIRSRAA